MPARVCAIATRQHSSRGQTASDSGSYSGKSQVLSTAFLAGQGPLAGQTTKDWMWSGKDIASVWPDLAGEGRPRTNVPLLLDSRP